MEIDAEIVIRHLLDIKAGQAEARSRLDLIEKAVMGNGQPGLVQKVEDLEKDQNKAKGVGLILALLLGVAEWFFNRK